MKRRTVRTVARVTRAAAPRIPAGTRLGELKCVDSPVVSQLLTNAGFVINANLVATGDQFYNRIGRKIYMKSLELRWSFVFNNVATPTTSTPVVHTRMLVIYDKAPLASGAEPAMADILQDVEQNGAGYSVSASAKNLLNASRFKVIRDKDFILPGNYGYSGGGNKTFQLFGTNEVLIVS